MASKLRSSSPTAGWRSRLRPLRWNLTLCEAQCWRHSHVNGQLLVCTDGIGLVGTRDGKTVVLRAGESVWTPAGEEHFHGGTAENMMCHYAILDASGGGEATTWLEPVTDEQYLAAHRTAGV
jgi:hypothetical protein